MSIERLGAARAQLGIVAALHDAEQRVAFARASSNARLLRSAQRMRQLHRAFDLGARCSAA